MAHDPENVRRAWEAATDEDIRAALFEYPAEYSPEVLEIILQVAEARGIEVPSRDALMNLRAAMSPRNDPDAAGVAKPYEVLGRPLVCQVCGHELFYERSAQLNTALASFLDLDWLNKTATCLTCARCRYVYWFA